MFLWKRASSHSTLPLYSQMSKTHPVTNGQRFPQDEFGNFTNLLDKLLAVPHSKIKAELDAEKRKKRTQKKRAAVGHAFRDED
jgi:hypothetical protein